jgi:Mitochondrial carrier protein
MHGVFQTIFQRGISAGLYFPLEEIFISYLKESFKSPKSTPGSNETWLLLCAGLMAGAGNGFIMNPISSIKYHYWATSGGSEVYNSSVKRNGTNPVQMKTDTFFTVAADMLRRGGLRPFFVGVNATISRDIIFGGVFAYLRHELPKQPFFSTYCSSSSAAPCSSIASSFSNLATSSNSSSSSHASESLICCRNSSNSQNGPQQTFLTDLLSGLIATTLSSPLNYVRNIHYSLPPDVKPASTFTVLGELWMKASEEQTSLGRLSHIQSRLRLGWGTARVGCGMALASQFYSFIKARL